MKTSAMAAVAALTLIAGAGVVTVIMPRGQAALTQSIRPLARPILLTSSAPLARPVPPQVMTAIAPPLALAPIVVARIDAPQAPLPETSPAPARALPIGDSMVATAVRLPETFAQSEAVAVASTAQPLPHPLSRPAVAPEVTVATASDMVPVARPSVAAPGLAALLHPQARPGSTIIPDQTVIAGLTAALHPTERPVGLASAPAMATPAVALLRPAERPATLALAATRPAIQPAVEVAVMRPMERPAALVAQPAVAIVSAAPASPAPQAAPAEAVITPVAATTSAAPPARSLGTLLGLGQPVRGACSRAMDAAIPARPGRALTGSEFLKSVINLWGPDRDAAVVQQVLSGNIPSFLRNLTPVNFSGTTADGRGVTITLCVMPDYLAIGDDADFVRMPMGLPAAAKIAQRFHFLLPTTTMVDAIYAQAQNHLPPRPMPAGAQMTSTAYLARHNQTVSAQLGAAAGAGEQLTAGQKKDIVLTNRLLSARGKVAIYGWHRTNGQPIQPLSTVHQASYADYSHGLRLVSDTAIVNGRSMSLADVLADPQLSGIISREGPISNAYGLLASLSN
ncbi:MAG: hypothetical protein GC146_17255 [Limimaricola sp.]|uniref:hypothetical protein n=1 Tax=Limimaricola sp. TaxID=2211665 RepID=UPI001D52B4D2|nr:hypothetical protein [Limimaricola sp.]MBI1418962.1 hypothetical protein [Limimaricola sp.]